MGMQSAFGDFGHIIKIETPGGRGVAYISFQDKRDAQDAVKSMDGESFEGNKMKVSMAEDRPPPSSSKPSRDPQAPRAANNDTEEPKSARGATRSEAQPTPHRRQKAPRKSSSSSRSGASKSASRSPSRRRGRKRERSGDSHRNK